MTLPIKLIPGTNVHHLHGIPVTSKGRPVYQDIVQFTMKGKKTHNVKKPLLWLQLMAKTNDGIPQHLMEYVDLIEFKTVLMPTYDDWYTPIPVLSSHIINHDNGEPLHIIPGFLYNAVDLEGTIYELYHSKKTKEWYWEEVYPNQRECYDLINSVDGDLLELTDEDITGLFLGNTNEEVAKKCAEKKMEVETKFDNFRSDPFQALSVVKEKLKQTQLA